MAGPGMKSEGLIRQQMTQSEMQHRGFIHLASPLYERYRIQEQMNNGIPPAARTRDRNKRDWQRQEHVMLNTEVESRCRGRRRWGISANGALRQSR